jgi:hypothetical protein
MCCLVTRGTIRSSAVVSVPVTSQGQVPKVGVDHTMKQTKKNKTRNSSRTNVRWQGLAQCDTCTMDCKFIRPQVQSWVCPAADMHAA